MQQDVSFSPLLLWRPPQPFNQNDKDQQLNEVRFCQACAGRLPIIHQSVCGVPAALCIDTNAHRDRPRLQNRVIWLWKHIKHQGARRKKTKGETLICNSQGQSKRWGAATHKENLLLFWLKKTVTGIMRENPIKHAVSMFITNTLLRALACPCPNNTMDVMLSTLWMKNEKEKPRVETDCTCSSADYVLSYKEEDGTDRHWSHWPVCFCFFPSLLRSEECVWGNNLVVWQQAAATTKKSQVIFDVYQTQEGWTDRNWW